MEYLWSIQHFLNKSTKESLYFMQREKEREREREKERDRQREKERE